MNTPRTWIIKEKHIVCVVLMPLAVFLFLSTQRGRLFTWADAEGYYLYLPALTIYGFRDLPLKSAYQKVEATGRYYDKYTAGVAIMQSPFYALACGYAAIHDDYPVDGFGRPFQRAILLSSIFYVFLGLWILYWFLRKSYSVFVSSITILCIFLGTNLLYYTYREPGMAHAYSFFLWCALVYITSRLYSNPVWKNFALVAIVISLMVFIRPSNAVAVLLVLFWDSSDLRMRLRFLITHALKYTACILPFILLAAMQLTLWRQMTGESVFFSYNQEPGFIYFHNPKILNVLFHVHNGLFIYAPVLVFAVVGLIVGIIRRQQNFILITIILTISTYLFGSWWAWWFGGAYGHRSYVDLFPLFAIPTAYIFKVVANSRWLVPKMLVFTSCIFLMYYSLQMSWAYIAPWDGPNFGWAEFWSIFKEALSHPWT